jgi:hypothetical protein
MAAPAPRGKGDSATRSVCNLSPSTPDRGVRGFRSFRAFGRDSAKYRGMSKAGSRKRRSAGAAAPRERGGQARPLLLDHFDTPEEQPTSQGS